MTERKSNVVTRWGLAAPLFLPLVAVVGVLLGQEWWLLSAGVVLLALVVRLWRVAACAFLCAAIMAVHGSLWQENAEELRSATGLVRITGTVERVMSSSVLIHRGWTQAGVQLRGEGTEHFQVGDAVDVLAERLTTHSAPLPGMFDAPTWMRGQGIAAAFRLVRNEGLPSRPMSLHLIRKWGLDMREALVRRIMPRGTESDARRQVLAALVLGARESAEDETLEGFRRGGCLHAFAVSGLHVGLVWGILWLVIRLLRVRPVVARPVLLVAVGVYVLITGVPVPAIRAYVMLAVAMGAFILRRQGNMLNTWSFAALLILMVAPHQLYNAGFLLSFAVYAAIGVGVRLCMGDRPWFGPDAFIPYRIMSRAELSYKQAELALRGVCVVSLSAWLVSLPITYLCFHTFNTYAVLTNIAISPLLPLVMGAGLLHLALGWIPLLGIATEWVMLRLASVLLAVVGFFGDLPSSYLPAAPPAGAESLLIMGTGYGKSCAMLGNPALVVDVGSESEAQFTVQPALFHTGRTPVALLQTRKLKGLSEGTDAFLKQYPQVLRAPRQGCVETSAGTYTLYAAPPDYTQTPAANQAPVVLWQSATQRVLYVGDAPYAAWSTIPQHERRADIVILGCNPTFPVADSEELRACGAKQIILLPSAAGLKLNTERLAPAHIIRMRSRDVLQLPLAGGDNQALEQ